MYSTWSELILTKNGLGEILCDFFTNSSGRPDAPLPYAYLTHVEDVIAETNNVSKEIILILKFNRD
jgi:hypothetical protein